MVGGRIKASLGQRGKVVYLLGRAASGMRRNPLPVLRDFGRTGGLVQGRVLPKAL